MTLRERSRKEGTRDVIFLFQAAEFVWTHAEPQYRGADFDLEYGHDGEGWALGTCDEKGLWGPLPEDHPEATDGYLSVEELEDMECVVKVWRTEQVFLTREEGTDYGNARHYNYTDGWRVYGVCASPLLAEAILKSERS